MEPALRDDLTVLLVDVQTSFALQAAGDAMAAIARTERLLLLAQMAGLPVIVTLERPVAEKGPLHERLAAALPPAATVLEKSTFDALGEQAVRDALAATGRGTVAVAGAETDVCVLLTVLGLRAAGYRVHVLCDCVFTSADDAATALRRMERSGAVPTTFKTLAYEVTETVDRSVWPAAWRERLATRPELFPPPEEAPRGD